MYLDTTNVNFHRKLFHCALSITLAELWIMFSMFQTIHSLGWMPGLRRVSKLCWDLWVCVKHFASLNCFLLLLKCLVSFTYQQIYMSVYFILGSRHAVKKKKSLFSSVYIYLYFLFYLDSYLKFYGHINANFSGNFQMLGYWSPKHLLAGEWILWDYEVYFGQFVLNSLTEQTLLLLTFIGLEKSYFMLFMLVLYVCVSERPSCLKSKSK